MLYLGFVVSMCVCTAIRYEVAFNGDWWREKFQSYNAKTK